MVINTRCFGEIEVSQEKIIRFDSGLMGFEEYKEFTLLFDSEKKADKTIMWLQSIDEVSFALPVINPMLISEDYNPVVEDELLASVGKIEEDDLLILVTLTVPADITKMTANYKAPIVINAGSLKGVQLIAENEEYLVKHPVYEILKSRKGGE